MPFEISPHRKKNNNVIAKIGITSLVASSFLVQMYSANSDPQLTPITESDYPNAPITAPSPSNVSRGESRNAEVFEQAKVINAIKSNLGGVLQNKASYIYFTSKAYNVNPMMVAAIAKHETHNGSSKVIINANNPGGLVWYNGCPYPKYGIFINYPSLEKGLEDMIRQLKVFYIDQGLTSIEQIQKVYCPVGANNDPNKLNQNWLPKVTEFYLKILEESK